MRIFKQLAHLYTAAALAAAAAACHDGDGLTPGTEPSREREIEVSIHAPATRTALLEDGLTARWVKGDRIALWAYTGGTEAFANVPFTLWYPRETPEQGLFTGMVGAMAAGTYDYYAAYPEPETAEGTKVSYTIPAVQDGTWNGDLDIMLAATQGAELKEEILNEVTLQFQHKVHALKITVPEGRNLLGGPIEKLRIEFPQPVAGRLTWDLTDPSGTSETAATERAVTLDFATPVDEGDTFWVYIAPADLTGGEVKFTATDGTEFSWPLSAWSFRDCAEGRITPVRLTIDEIRPQHRYLLTVDPTHLGEPVTQIDSLIMPEGYEFPSLALRNTSGPITVNADGTCTVGVFEDQPDPFATSDLIAMSVSSENTAGVYSKKCEISNVTADGCTVMAPYLFFEDFSLLNGYDINGGNVSDKETSGQYINDTFHLEGWTGNQTYGTAGKAIAIRSRYETSIRKVRGRVDSAPMKYLKENAKVKVKVNFKYGSSAEETKSSYQMNYGYTTTQGPIKAFDTGTGNEVENAQSVTLTDNNGSTSNVNLEITDFIIQDCTSATRLSWELQTGSKAFDSKNKWLYIDDIRVTIVP